MLSAPVKSVLYPILALVGLVLFWQLLAGAMNDPRLPSFTAVAEEISANANLYATNTALTLLEGALGLLLAIVGGFLLSLVLVSSTTVRTAFMPYVIAAQSIPLIAIAPLLAVWFGEGFFSKVLIAAMLCWFPTVMNATRGMLLLDPVHASIFKVSGASRWDTLQKLRIPNSIAFLHSGIRISAGLAMIGAIIAEYGPVGSGLGHLVFMESLGDPRNHPRLYAATIFAAGSGWLLAETANLAFRAVFARYMPQTRD